MGFNWKDCSGIRETDFYFHKLHSLRQTSSVNLYQRQFNVLRSLVGVRYPYFDEAYFISCCINGFTKAIQEVVQLFSPFSVEYCFHIALMQESLPSMKSKQSLVSNDNAIDVTVVAENSSTPMSVHCSSWVEAQCVPNSCEYVPPAAKENYVIVEASSSPYDLTGENFLTEENLEVTDNVLLPPSSNANDNSEASLVNEFLVASGEATLASTSMVLETFAVHHETAFPLITHTLGVTSVHFTSALHNSIARVGGNDEEQERAELGSHQPSLVLHLTYSLTLLCSLVLLFTFLA